MCREHALGPPGVGVGEVRPQNGWVRECGGRERSPGRGTSTGQGPGWGGSLCGRNWKNCVSEAQGKEEGAQEGMEAM